MLCGWEVMKIAWFPIVFLVAAIPWPQLVYSWVAMPLQEMAASAAVFTLRMTGVEAIRDGTSLVIGAGVNARTLNVAEACAGLKSLMAFVTLAAAIGFLSSRPLWQKITVTVSAVPIAIFCNMMRVSGQGLLDNWGLRQLSEGFAHQFVGMVMLIPAFFLILGVAYLMDNLFVDEEQRKREAQKRGIKGVESLVIEAPRRVAGPGAPDEPAAKEDLAAATRRLMTASLRRRPGAHAAGHASSPRPEAS
jgi:exosortase/archaeosortase family protein